MPSPKILAADLDARVRSARRLQASFLAAGERRLLVTVAEHLPPSINSDHLTALGFLAQLLTGFSYRMAGSNPMWLLAAIGFLTLNWLGDSLDGTLARVRAKERPRYGFYVDHMLDSIGAVGLLGGLALSGYMSPAISITLLVLFLLLSIHSYLATYTLGEFQMSFWSFGPTELRVLLVLGNLAALRWPRVLNQHYLLFDVGGGIGILGMSAMLLVSTALNMRRLSIEESAS
jgi:archaetidylinositol phosphate synthase